jgi:hypothetical protein
MPPAFRVDGASDDDEDGGGKNDNCEAGTRRIVAVGCMFIAGDNDDVKDGVGSRRWVWVEGAAEMLVLGTEWIVFPLLPSRLPRVRSRGIYSILRIWMLSDAQRWFARRSSAIGMPYLTDTPASESVEVTFTRHEIQNISLII